MSISSSFIRGLGSISLFPEESGADLMVFDKTDEEEIREDWETVGQDLLEVSDKIRISNEQSSGRK